jgi:hypothetical protein
MTSVSFYALIRKQTNDNIHDVSNAYSPSHHTFSMRYTGQGFESGKATEFNKEGKAKLIVLSEPELGRRNRAREDGRLKGQEDV